jgi:hypothetical protein
LMSQLISRLITILTESMMLPLVDEGVG